MISAVHLQQEEILRLIILDAEERRSVVSHQVQLQIVAIDDSRSLSRGYGWCSRIFRHNSRAVHLEFPDGETPLTACVRIVARLDSHIACHTAADIVGIDFFNRGPRIRCDRIGIDGPPLRVIIRRSRQSLASLE